MTCRRDRPGREGKQFGISIQGSELTSHIRSLLDEIQQNLLNEATSFRDANIVDVENYEDFKVSISRAWLFESDCVVLKAAIAKGQWARGPWNGSDEDEKQIKEETQATLRCFPFDQPKNIGSCFYTNQTATEVAIFAKAY